MILIALTLTYTMHTVVSHHALLYSPELAILQTFILKRCQEIVSFVKLSEIGIRGRNNDILTLLTDHQYGGRTTYMVTYYTESDDDTAITNTM